MSLSNQQHCTGNASEHYVAYLLASQGWSIFWPTSPQSPADLLAMHPEGAVWKVQVKTATRCVGGKNGRGVFHQVRLGGCGRPAYNGRTVSHFAVVLDKQVSMIPYHMLEGKASFSMGKRSANKALFDRYVIS